MDFNEPKKNALLHEVGMGLDAMSVDELGRRIEMLRLEIVRLEKEITNKSASRSAAESVFK